MRERLKIVEMRDSAAAISVLELWNHASPKRAQNLPAYWIEVVRSESSRINESEPCDDKSTMVVIGATGSEGLNASTRVRLLVPVLLTASCETGHETSLANLGECTRQVVCN